MRAGAARRFKEFLHSKNFQKSKRAGLHTVRVVWWHYATRDASIFTVTIYVEAKHHEESSGVALRVVLHIETPTFC
jgi:hypothetical protein